MTPYVRPWLVLLALLTPAVGSDLRAEHDWACVIVAPSSYDWCGRHCYGLPSLGVHKAALRRE